MRARRFTPLVDLLDPRLLLDGSGSTGPVLASMTSPPGAADGGMPGDSIDLTGGGDGSSSSGSSDPTNPPLNQYVYGS